MFYFASHEGIAAIMGNAMVLRIYSCCKSLRTPSNMLVINLAVSDLMLMITLVLGNTMSVFGLIINKLTANKYNQSRFPKQ